jgi:hypothetical protein
MTVVLGVVIVVLFVGQWLIYKGAIDKGRVVAGILLLCVGSMLLGLWVTSQTIGGNLSTSTVTAVDTLSRVSSVDTVTVIQYTLSD